MNQGRLHFTLPPGLPAGDCSTPIPGGGGVWGWYYVEAHPQPFIIIQGDLGEYALVWLGTEGSAAAVGNYISGNPTGGPSWTPDELQHLVELALADLDAKI